MNNFMLLISAFLAINLVQSLPNGPSYHVDSFEAIFEGDVEPFVGSNEDASRMAEIDEYSDEKVPKLDNNIASRKKRMDAQMVHGGGNKFSYHLPEDFDMSKIDNETDIEKLLKDHEEEIKEFKDGLEYITANTSGVRFYDCQVHYNQGARINGVYTIHPSGSPDPFEAYCDFYTSAGGWTMIMKRSNGYPFFYRDWSTYVRGFGLQANDHWLGLDNIHYLSTQKLYKLRVDLYDCDGSHRFAEYNHFAIGGPGTNYELLLGIYSGDAGDSLSFHRYQPFSTFDRDNDAYSSNCAQMYKGGWWYKDCYEANLNGIFYNCNQGPPGSTGVAWKTFRGFSYSMARVEMKILPL